MYHWGLKVDGVTVVMLIVAIGLAIDYSAHIGVAYLHSTYRTADEAVVNALVDMGTPVVHGATPPSSPSSCSPPRPPTSSSPFSGSSSLPPSSGAGMVSSSSPCSSPSSAPPPAGSTSPTSSSLPPKRSTLPRACPLLRWHSRISSRRIEVARGAGRGGQIEGQIEGGSRVLPRVVEAHC